MFGFLQGMGRMTAISSMQGGGGMGSGMGGGMGSSMGGGRMDTDAAPRYAAGRAAAVQAVMVGTQGSQGLPTQPCNAALPPTRNPAPTLLCSYRPEPAASAYSKAAEPARGPKKGMQLGKSKAGGRDFLESLKAEGEAVEDVSSAAGARCGGAAGQLGGQEWCGSSGGSRCRRGCPLLQGMPLQGVAAASRCLPRWPSVLG